MNGENRRDSQLESIISSQQNEKNSETHKDFTTYLKNISLDQPITNIPPDPYVFMDKLTSLFKKKISTQSIASDEKLNSLKKFLHYINNFISHFIQTLKKNLVNNFFLSVLDSEPLPIAEKRTSWQLDFNNFDSQSNAKFENSVIQKNLTIKAHMESGENIQERNSYLLNLNLLQELHQKKKPEPIHKINMFKTIKINKRKTFYDVIANFYLAKKFMGVLKNLSRKRTPKYLNKYQFSLIGDPSFFQPVYKKYLERREELNMTLEKSKTLQIISSHVVYKKAFVKFLRLLNRIKIFDPSTTSFLLWDFIIMFCLLMNLVILPLEISFGFEIQEQWQNLAYFKIISTYLLVANIFIKFNTAYYKKGVIVQKRKSIIENYIYNAFIKDLISVIPLLSKEILIIENWWLSFIMMMIAFALLRASFETILKKFEELIFFDKTIKNKLALFKIIIRILISSHLLACLWHLIGFKTSKGNENSWLLDKDLLESRWYVRYAYSYYYICVTMNTVGYGDITPKNTSEILFNIILINVSCALFAYTINSIGLIVSDIMKQENECKNDLNTINDFMREKNIGYDLRMRVRKYLEYIWHEERIDKVEHQAKIVQKLSDSLKEELLLEANGTMIRDVKMLSLNFSEDTLRRVVSVMKEVRYTPGDLIFMKGDTENRDLYIIRKGEIEIFMETSKSTSPVTVLKTLKEGDVYGELAFFSGQARSACARSTDFTTVFVIKQVDFLNILMRNGKDFEKYNEIKDNINIYGDYSDIFFKCYSCNDSNHPVSNCRIVHNYILSDIVINRHIFTQPNERKVEWRRRKKKSHNVKKCFANIEIAAFRIQLELFPSHESEEEESESSDTEHNENNNEDLINEQDEGGLINKSPDQIKSNEINGKKSKPTARKDRRKTRKNKFILRKSLKQIATKILFNSLSKSSDFDGENAEAFRKIGEQVKNLLKIEKTSKFDLTPPNNSNDSKKTLFNQSNELRKSNGSISFNQEKNSESSALMSILKGWVESTKQRSKSKIIPLTNSLFVSQPHFLLMDRIKSFDFYFFYNNIENIIDKMETKIKPKRKIKKQGETTFKTNVFKEKTINLVDGNLMSHARGSLAGHKFDNINDSSDKKSLIYHNNNVMRKNFFKNAHHLEKLLEEEKFDPKKMKEFYRNKFLTGKKRGFLGYLSSCFLDLLKSLFCCRTSKKKTNERKKRLMN